MILRLLLIGLVCCPVRASYAEPVTVVDAFDNEVTVEDASRIVSISGDITEILNALIGMDRVVARDDTSTWPPSVNELPSVGYVRTLNTEGILSMNPSLILLSENAGPPPVLQQLRQTGIPMVFIPTGSNLKTVNQKINLIASAVGVPEKGVALADALHKQNKSLRKSLADIEEPPRILFLLNAQAGSFMASGSGTAADNAIQLAGGSNVFSDFEGYKQISIEAALQAKPDVILLPSHGVTMMGGLDRFTAIPGVSDTPAAKHDKIIVMDSQFLLSFGPRFLQAAAELASKIHPEYTIPQNLRVHESGIHE